MMLQKATLVAKQDAMTTKTIERIDTERLKESVDLRELAGQRTELRKESTSELAGPCPKCGGDDRFHVTKSWAFCRQCWAKGGDPIAYLQWLDGVSFRQACEQLANGDLPTSNRAPAQRATAAHVENAPQSQAWRERATRLLYSAQRALWQHEPAMEYLRGRGLASVAWLEFGLGYVDSSPTAERAPAIVLPWFRRGQLEALRFRFLDVQRSTDKQGKYHKTKIKALKGSQFAGLLFGGQVEPLPHKQRTLLLCEGEINAMSIWQVAHESRLDVLSVGSESAWLSPAMIDIAKQYGQVFCWFDRAEVAKEQALKIGAHAISSPGHSDANDLLQDGTLGYALSYWRYEAAKTPEQREALLWALYDAASTLLGVDVGTAKLIKTLASELGKNASVYCAEPGRWVAER